LKKPKIKKDKTKLREVIGNIISKAKYAVSTVSGTTSILNLLK